MRTIHKIIVENHLGKSIQERIFAEKKNAELVMDDIQKTIDKLGSSKTGLTVRIETSRVEDL